MLEKPSQDVILVEHTSRPCRRRSGCGGWTAKGILAITIYLSIETDEMLQSRKMRAEIGLILAAGSQGVRSLIVSSTLEDTQRADQTHLV